jgi:DNA-binding transcriptional MerR regulator
MHVLAPPPDIASPPLSRREAARFLQVHPVTLAKWAQAGTGPRYARTGEHRGRVLYELHDLREWLEQHKRCRS